jgi:hypothetical protein
MVLFDLNGEHKVCQISIGTTYQNGHKIYQMDSVEAKKWTIWTNLSQW